MKNILKSLVLVMVLALSLVVLTSCKGNDGKSAYDIAVEYGFVGTEEEWLESLIGAQGPQGEKGETGAQGPQGEPGKDGVNGTDGKDGADGEDGKDGADGEDGKDGSTGATGATGPQGAQGEKGETGAQGEKGETGAQGPQGDKGETGAQGVGIANIEIKYEFGTDGKEYMVFVVTYTNGEIQEIKANIPAKDTWDGSTADINTVEQEEDGTYVVKKASELAAVLALATDGKANPGDITISLEANLNMNGIAWTPIEVDGYGGTDIVTIEGNGNIITGLTAPLFHGGFAGGSGIVINDLTISSSNIVSASTQGSGAFIECIDSMDTITLNNCHLIDSTVTGSRTGGLIGWTAGYNNENDGPVKTIITITDCSVVNCEITGVGSVGAIIGHAGNNPWTWHTIENCTVSGNTLTAIDDGDLRVGSIVGTANVGEVVINNCTIEDNTMTQLNPTDNSVLYENDKVYGRCVFGTTGTLTIDGYSVVTTAAELGNLIANAEDGVVKIAGGKVELPSSLSNSKVTIIGTKDTVIDISKAIALNGSDITLKGVTIQGSNSNYVGIQHASSVTYEDCVFNDGMFLYATNVVFNNCEFNLSTQYVWTYGAKNVTFNNCEFNTDGKAILVYTESSSLDHVVNVVDCTFNATTSAYTSAGDKCAAVEIDASLPNGGTGTFAVNFSGTNEVDEDFAGIYRIKKGKATINGTVTEPETPTHEHTACETCGLCTSTDCTGTEEKCAGHTEQPTFTTHESIVAEFLKDYNAFASAEYTTVAAYWSDGQKTSFWKDAEMHAKWSWIFEALKPLASAQGIDTQYIDNMLAETITVSGYATQNVAIFLLQIDATTWVNDYAAYGGLSSKWTTVNCTGVTFDTYSSLLPAEYFG